ncbi:MAG: amino acid ABC transporter permease [Nocardioidaceae bacterium]|uniref:Polar amino acid transport system permease protein n=1 Tax=Janibacter cremeus TaxID=1285192 RepID=A0A852VLU2_9MICO|nr:amino acid ABC transporter permease [Janibacter cremeus]MDN5745437.1 amino acid ABC transporter permease [Nocardioidaceae bacterium]NYF98047.1 polar amino acid transport system permease protein [Janibacter cremeus]
MTSVSDVSSHVRDEPPPQSVTPIEAIPVRRPVRWLVTAACLAVAVSLAYSVSVNERYQWDVVGNYLFAAPILQGLVVTIELTAIGMAIGIVLGVLMAVMRLSDVPAARVFSWLYLGFFRGTPVLVQLIFWYNLAALYPELTLGIPFGPDLWLVDVNVLITPFVAAILGLGLNEGAYMAEIVRSGILSVGTGQSQAAAALGLSRRQTMRRIVLPQAMRVIVPPTGNQLITMLKMTAVVSVIAMSELLYSAQTIYSQTYEVIPLLIVVSIWYLVVTTLLTIGQSFLERRFSRGFSRGERISAKQALLQALPIPSRSRHTRSNA